MDSGLRRNDEFGENVREQTVTQDESDMRLDRWLRSHVPNLPQGLLQKHLRRGVIRVDGAKAKHNDRVHEGQVIRFPEYNDLDEKAKPTRPSLSEKQHHFAASLVLKETSDWLAINKPAGLAVQGGSGIKECVEDYFPAWGDEVRLVHRLDKETSGVLLLAKTRQSAQSLTRAFKEKNMQKTYLAVVLGVPEHMGGEISMPLAKRRIAGEEKMVAAEKGDEDAQFAASTYHVLDHIGNEAALVALSPLTGRTHQLRVHCASGLGCPILGDVKYGGSVPAELADMKLGQGMHLHAQRIELEAMSIEVEAPLPAHMKLTMKELGLAI